MPRPFVLAALAALALGSAQAQPADPDRPPFELVYAQPGDGPMSAYLRLLEAEPGYPDGSGGVGFVRQQLAQRSALLGLHADALRWDAVAFGYRPDSTAALPPGTRAVGAAEAVLARVGDGRVVMVNEAHHDASSRLLTRELLAPLYARGFRYLAAETFAPDSILSTVADHPTRGMGFYSDEPVFGALVREALRLGYTLVPYEEQRGDAVAGDTLTGQQRRDLSQAQRLAAVLERDPAARVLVHAGYQHIAEAPTEWFSPAAWYLRELTGVDPLTVDQTEVWSTTEPAYQHPVFRAAAAAGFLADGPVVLVDGDGAPVPVSDDPPAVDLVVVRPLVTEPLAALGFEPLRAVPLPAGCGACVVEVRRMGEPAEAVPLARSAVHEGGSVALWGPPGAALVYVVLDGRTGRALDRRLALPD